MDKPSLSVFPINRGPEGVKSTLLFMRDLVRKSDSDRIVKETAHKIILNVPQRDLMLQVKTIVGWVKRSLHYVRDIYGTEECTNPAVQLHNIESNRYEHSSDCDDFAMLISALLRVVGFPTRLEAVAVNNTLGYDHARVSVRIGEYWYPIEGTRKELPVGKGLKSKLPIMAVEV